MPSNRNALLRRTEIDKCLKNRGRKYTWRDILNKVNEALRLDDPKSPGISKTTLYEDLKDIEWRIYKLEIEKTKDGKTAYLRYANPSDSINNLPLNESEISQLKTAVKVILRFSGLPQFDWIHEIIPILETKLGLINIEREIISFESDPDYAGTVHIPAIFNAILNKRVIKLTYQDFKSPLAYEVEIHPQYLKQFNSRWFIMSFMDMWGNKPQIHALDRIKKLQEVGAKYKTESNFDWDNYFSDMIGVTRLSKEPVEVHLLILDEEQAAYINTRPLHQTQKPIKKVTDGYQTSITVIPNYELEKLLLSFGERIKVLSPLSLKERIKVRISKLNKLYGS